MGRRPAYLRRETVRVAGVLVIFAFVSLSTEGRLANGAFSDLRGPDRVSVRVGVLGLFHPKNLRVLATKGQALVVRCGDQNLVLEHSGNQAATATLEGSEVVVTSGVKRIRATTVQIAGRENQPVDFVLEISGKITRPYHGALQIKPSSADLSAIVTIDLETAVASVVAAESTPETPLEALKAYAVAARSYFLSGRGRHKEFDFCDTTHCQFLRTPPPASTGAAKAVSDTRGLVLWYQGRSFAAMYTRSCSGRTRTPAELGLKAGSYPYYPVACQHCRLHPTHWTSRLAPTDAAALHPSDESKRLAIDHRLGWNAVQSNDFSLKKKGDFVLLEGEGYGHGIGLCQAGARAMAERGATFLQILDHYYPNTNVVSDSR